MIFNNDELDINLLPATIYPPIREYYTKYSKLIQHDDINARNDWIKIFNIQFRTVIRERLPNIERVMWPDERSNYRLVRVTIDDVTYTFSDINGGGIFFTMIVSLFYYGESQELINEFSTIRLNNSDANSKNWIERTIKRILETQLNKLNLSEQDKQFTINTNGNANGQADTLEIRIFNFLHYTNTGHSDIDILENRNSQNNLKLYHFNNILNVIYYPLHDKLILKYLHINKQYSNYSDMILRGMFGENFDTFEINNEDDEQNRKVRNIRNIINTILDPRFGDNHMYFNHLFGGISPGFEMYNNQYNVIQIMTKLLYTYKEEIKYFFENRLLAVSHQIKQNISNPEIMNDIINNINTYDNFFNDNGFVKFFIDLLSQLGTSTATITAQEMQDLNGDNYFQNDMERRLYNSRPKDFRNVAILFRKCITNIHLNSTLFRLLKLDNYYIFDNDIIDNTSVINNFNIINFYKILGHYCMTDQKIDNFIKIMDIIISSHINENNLETLIRHFWLFYYNKEENNNNSNLNKFIFDTFINRLVKYNSNNTNRIKVFYLLLGIQPDIIYNYNSIINDVYNISTSIIFDEASQIGPLIRQRIIFTDSKGEYFTGKTLIREIANSMLQNIIPNVPEYLNTLSNIETNYSNEPNIDLINLKLALIQKDYVEYIVRNITNPKFTFYTNNKETIIDTITNIFLKEPENGFLINIHDILSDLEILDTPMLTYLMINNNANPLLYKLLVNYPFNLYDIILPHYQLHSNEYINPDNNISNIRNIEQRLTQRLNILIELRPYLHIVIRSLRNRTNESYNTILDRMNTLENRNNIYSRQIQNINTYYSNKYITIAPPYRMQNNLNLPPRARTPLVGGYKQKYLKYKQKYIRLLNKQI
jgi:hypothetical protein